MSKRDKLIDFYEKEIEALEWVSKNKTDGMDLIANVIAQCRVSELQEKKLLLELEEE